MRRYRLGLGVRLVATEEGVIGLLPQSRSLRIQLGSREFESDLVGALATGGHLASVGEKHGPGALSAALTALEQQFIIGPAAHVLDVDLHVDEERCLEAGASLAALGDDPSWTEVSLLAPLGSRLLPAWLHELRARQLPVLLAWTAGTTVAVGFDDGRSGPCLRCALTLDRELRPSSPGVLEGRAQGPRATAQAWSLASAVLSTMKSPGSSRPSVGQVLLLDASGWSTEWQTFVRHPGCPCQTEPTRVGPYRSWPECHARRFSPLICLDAGEGAKPARVLFRRTRQLRQLSASDYGIASASGESATLRAFAEGVERFCMLHRPPDVGATAATALEDPAFDEATIRSALFSNELRSLPGFRHPDFDMNLALDWSWASPAGSYGTGAEAPARRLVPTSLIGRPAEASPRLIDPSSSGYAAHTDAQKAIALAALEIIERDAVLLWWHAGAPIVRICGGAFPTSWKADAEAYLVTQDVDLPVVMIIAKLPSGGLRLTSAAAATFEGAWRKAVTEMDVALWTLERFGVRSPTTPLSDPRGKHGPTDHLAHFLGADHAQLLFAQLSASATDLQVTQLESEWAADDAESLPAVLTALEACGLEAWAVDRSLPELFGPDWHVVRVFIPDALEVAWGASYARLGSRRYAAALRRGRANLAAHPIA